MIVLCVHKLIAEITIRQLDLQITTFQKRAIWIDLEALLLHNFSSN